MRAALTALLLFALTCGGALAEGAIQPPDVDRVTFEQYLDGATCNVDMKERSGLYMEGLEKALQKAASAVSDRLSKNGAIQAQFRAAHGEFLLFAQSSPMLAETLNWVDLESGETFHGTAYGYSYVALRCSLLWQQTRAYRRLLASGDPSTLGENSIFASDGPVGGPARIDPRSER